MVVVDLPIVLIVGLLTLMGLRSGLIHESITLLGLIAGLYVAGRSYPLFGPLFLPYVHSRDMSHLAAFLAILLVTWAVVLLLGTLARLFLEGVRLGWIDNLAGAVLGLAKGLFLAEVIVLVLLAMPSKTIGAAVERSWIGGRLALLAPLLLRLIPPILRYWKPL